jgi:hypothetical protein
MVWCIPRINSPVIGSLQKFMSHRKAAAQQLHIHSGRVCYTHSRDYILECVVSLPGVGENLQEHPITSVTYELTPGIDNITIDSVFLDQNLSAEHICRAPTTA